MIDEFCTPRPKTPSPLLGGSIWAGKERRTLFPLPTTHTTMISGRSLREAKKKGGGKEKERSQRRTLIFGARITFAYFFFFLSFPGKSCVRACCKKGVSLAP